jgi:hypothetical protein
LGLLAESVCDLQLPLRKDGLFNPYQSATTRLTEVQVPFGIEQFVTSFPLCFPSQLITLEVVKIGSTR